jgi:hypothetical protein
MSFADDGSTHSNLVLELLEQSAHRAELGALLRVLLRQRLKISHVHPITIGTGRTSSRNPVLDGSTDHAKNLGGLAFR